jgi:uncharacterized protein with PIN domain
MEAQQMSVYQQPMTFSHTARHQDIYYRVFTKHYLEAKKNECYVCDRQLHKVERAEKETSLDRKRNGNNRRAHPSPSRLLCVWGI